MTLVWDAGALMALERGDRATWERLKIANRLSERAVTHGGVIAQVWRGGYGRQVLLARALKAIEVVGLDEMLGRQAGMLLSQSATDDAVDAAVVALARDGDVILTSDPGDLIALVAASGRDAEVVPV